jgi:hypothetical protein
MQHANDAIDEVRRAEFSARTAHAGLVKGTLAAAELVGQPDGRQAPGLNQPFALN